MSIVDSTPDGTANQELNRDTLSHGVLNLKPPDNMPIVGSNYGAALLQAIPVVDFLLQVQKTKTVRQNPVIARFNTPLLGDGLPSHLAEDSKRIEAAKSWDKKLAHAITDLGLLAGISIACPDGSDDPDGVRFSDPELFFLKERIDHLMLPPTLRSKINPHAVKEMTQDQQEQIYQSHASGPDFRLEISGKPQYNQLISYESYGELRESYVQHTVLLTSNNSFLPEEPEIARPLDQDNLVLPDTRQTLQAFFEPNDNYINTIPPGRNQISTRDTDELNKLSIPTSREKLIELVGLEQLRVAAAEMKASETQSVVINRGETKGGLTYTEQHGVEILMFENNGYTIKYEKKSTEVHDDIGNNPEERVTLEYREPISEDNAARSREDQHLSILFGKTSASKRGQASHQIRAWKVVSGKFNYQLDGEIIMENEETRADINFHKLDLKT